jgi:hypothetical protein
MESLGNRNRRAGFRRLPPAGAAALLMLCWAVAVGPAFGQEAAPPAQPKTAAPSSPSVSGDPAAPAAPAWGPSLDWSPHKPHLEVEPDCFVNADIALVFPHLGSLLTGPVILENGTVTTVALRNARLDATVSPRFQLGALRFGPGYGEVAVGYHFLATEGTAQIPAFDASGAATVRSRLNLQTFDLDYLRNDCPLWWDAALSWYVGARLQIVFFDTQAQSAATYQQARNYFFGAGFHGGFTVTRPVSEGWQLFGRFDAGLLGGYNTVQNFVVRTTDPQNGTLAGEGNQEQSQFAPSLTAQAGLSWTPAGMPRLCVWGGYQFEQWYNLGRVKDSRGDLSTHGLFLSGEWNF